jgi:hypothetical protein
MSCNITKTDNTYISSTDATIDFYPFIIPYFDIDYTRNFYNIIQWVKKKRFSFPIKIDKSEYNTIIFFIGKGVIRAEYRKPEG